MGTISVSKYFLGRNPLYTQLGYRGIKQGAKGEARPELKKTEKAKIMDVTTAAKKAFSQAREKNPKIASAIIGVMRDPETDLVTDGGIIFETNLDVAKKQVQEWDLDGIYSKFDKTCSDFAGATGIEGTLWKVGFEIVGAKPIARMLAVIVKP